MRIVPLGAVRASLALMIAGLATPLQLARPSGQTSGAFASRKPSAAGHFARFLPRPEPTGCARNAGQIRRLGLGRLRPRIRRYADR